MNRPQQPAVRHLPQADPAPGHAPGREHLPVRGEEGYVFVEEISSQEWAALCETSARRAVPETNRILAHCGERLAVRGVGQAQYPARMTAEDHLPPHARERLPVQDVSVP